MANHSLERQAKIEIEHWLRQDREQSDCRGTQRNREEISSLEQGDSVACSWRFEITERALTERRGTPDRTTRDEENGLSGERKSRINQSSAGEQENKKEPGNRDLAIAGSHSFGGKTKDRTLRPKPNCRADPRDAHRNR
jgi:hypothetical protein